MTDENVNQNGDNSGGNVDNHDDGAKVEFSAEQQKKIDELISQRLKTVKEQHTKELQELNNRHKLDLDEAEKKQR